MSWVFDATAKRYRSTITGRFLPKRQVVALRDRVVDAAGTDAKALAVRYVRGEISPAQFRARMRLAIRNAHVANYVFGRGGVRAMTASDWGRLGYSLRQQYAFLERFVSDVANGTVSEAQAANRARMYTDGAIKAFAQGTASSFGVAGQLPEYPGERCHGLSNCRCRWEITETETEIEARWRLGASDACPVCQANAQTYNPYRMPKPLVREEQPVRLTQVRRRVA